MRSEGNGRPGLDRAALGREEAAGATKRAEGASSSDGAKAAEGPSAATTRDTGAVHRQASAVASGLQGATLEERPGAVERAKALLAEPFTKDTARATARAILTGESRPGPGQSLVP